jgi:methylenetetrahydrofolate reductase (NADPH)
VSWIKQLRTRGIDAPVSVGVPGSARVAKLLRFARQFGVASSARTVANMDFRWTICFNTWDLSNFSNGSVSE